MIFHAVLEYMFANKTNQFIVMLRKHGLGANPYSASPPTQKPFMTPIKTAHFGLFDVFPKKGKVNILWFIDCFFRFIRV